MISGNARHHEVRSSPRDVIVVLTNMCPNNAPESVHRVVSMKGSRLMRAAHQLNLHHGCAAYMTAGNARHEEIASSPTDVIVLPTNMCTTNKHPKCPPCSELDKDPDYGSRS